MPLDYVDYITRKYATVEVVCPMPIAKELMTQMHEAGWDFTRTGPKFVDVGRVDSKIFHGIARKEMEE